MELTDWFPKTTKPHHQGVYQIRGASDKLFFSFWNGNYWGLMAYTPAAATNMREKKSANQNKTWRGIKK